MAGSSSYVKSHGETPSLTDSNFSHIPERHHRLYGALSCPKEQEARQPSDKGGERTLYTGLAAEQTIAEPSLWGYRPSASLPSKYMQSHFSKTTILPNFGCYFAGRGRKEDLGIILTSAKLTSLLLSGDSSENRFRKATYAILCCAPAGKASAEIFGNYQFQAASQPAPKFSNLIIKT